MDKKRSKTKSEASRLREKEKKLCENFSEALQLRVSRAISWLERAESIDADDIDSRFIFLWISFNAAYAGDIIEGSPEKRNEHSVFRNFFRKIIGLDTNKRVYDIIWKQYSSAIQMLIKNKYVFEPFWKYHNGENNENWEKDFKNSQQRLNRALRDENTVGLLTVLFDRLYTLRNQLIHGGATWKSEVNRTQVRDGRCILESLVPVFIELMMEHPNQDWGRPWYPRLNDE